MARRLPELKHYPRSADTEIIDGGRITQTPSFLFWPWYPGSLGQRKGGLFSGSTVEVEAPVSEELST